MTKIDKVLRPVKYGVDDSYVLVAVKLDHGGEASVIVGGEVEEYFHNGQARAFVRKTKLDDDSGNDV